MENEKIKILKMLEDGKINADEAVRLLESIGINMQDEFEGNESGYGNNQQYNFSEGVNYEDSNYEQYSNQGNNNQNSSKGTNSNFAEELNKKIEILTNDLSPKIQKFAEAARDKAVSFADKVSKSVEDKPRQQWSATFNKYTGSNFTPDTANDFEISVLPGQNELEIECKNSGIKIRGYNGDKITAKVVYRLAFGVAESPIEFVHRDNKFLLIYDESKFRSVGIEAYVPSNMLDNIKLKNCNAKISVKNISTKCLFAFTKNAAISCESILCEDLINLNTKNAHIELKNVISKNSVLETANGSINLEEIDIENFKAVTSNASINGNIQNLNNYNEYTWVMNTSNGKMNFNVPFYAEVGYHIVGSTSLGQVKLNLPSLIYLSNSPNYAETVSPYFDNLPKHFNASFKTSNGNIIIN